MINRILWVAGALVAIALVTLVAILFIAQTKNNAEIAKVWNSLQTGTPPNERFSKDLVANQPEPVQRYFLHAIAPGTPLANSVHVTMKGTFRLAPDKD